MRDTAKAMGRCIRSCRAQKGWRQEKLAELSGCHPTYIGQSAREKGGIADRDLPCIWDRCYTARNRKHKAVVSGLGLSAAKEILTAH